MLDILTVVRPGVEPGGVREAFRACRECSDVQASAMADHLFHHRVVVVAGVGVVLVVDDSTIADMSGLAVSGIGLDCWGCNAGLFCIVFLLLRSLLTQISREIKAHLYLITCLVTIRI